MPAVYSSLDKKWIKPALIILCQNQPLVGTGGDAGKYDLTGGNGGAYIYLTDDGRSPVQVTPERIEQKQRMINGRLRSYHIADKNKFNMSWNNLPSRAREGNNSGDRKYISEYEQRSTTISYAAGQEMKTWYETYTGDFYAVMVYDSQFVANNPSQVEIYNVMFDDFSYDIVKRGQYNDLWDVSIALVEV